MGLIYTKELPSGQGTSPISILSLLPLSPTYLKDALRKIEPLAGPDYWQPDVDSGYPRWGERKTRTNLVLAYLPLPKAVFGFFQLQDDYNYSMILRLSQLHTTDSKLPQLCNEKTIPPSSSLI